MTAISKKDDAFYALIAQMNAQIAKMNEPKNNPAQDALTQSALSGYDWLKGGDYSQKPTGMFFDFKGPQEQIDQYKKFSNVNQGGTFALGDSAGQGHAMGLQNQYLNDKFARDASQNYQDNISNAAQNIRGGLASSAGAKAGNDASVVSALQGLGGVISSLPQKVPWWQTLLGQAGGIAGAAATAF